MTKVLCFKFTSIVLLPPDFHVTISFIDFAMYILAALEKRRMRLEAYLNYLLEYEEYRNHSEMVCKLFYFK